MDLVTIIIGPSSIHQYIAFTYVALYVRPGSHSYMQPTTMLMSQPPFFGTHVEMSFLNQPQYRPVIQTNQLLILPFFDDCERFYLMEDTGHIPSRLIYECTMDEVFSIISARSQHLYKLQYQLKYMKEHYTDITTWPLYQELRNMPATSPSYSATSPSYSATSPSYSAM